MDIKRHKENEFTEDRNGKKPAGIVKLDGSCAPIDIAYPMDTNLLNMAGEMLEDIIDRLDLRDKNSSVTRTSVCLRRRYSRAKYTTTMRTGSCARLTMTHISLISLMLNLCWGSVKMTFPADTK